MNQKAKLGVSGAAAGLVNGLFGGGGGMVMAPLLTGWCGLEQKRALATCVGGDIALLRAVGGYLRAAGRL